MKEQGFFRPKIKLINHESIIYLIIKKKYYLI